MFERRDWQNKGRLTGAALYGYTPIDLSLWSLLPLSACLVFIFLFQFTGFVSVCLTARRMRYKINLYPGFVVFPPPWQCVSVISRPVWFQAFQWVPTFANFRLLFLPHNAAHSPSVSLSLSLPSAPRLTPTQGVTQSIQMCFTLKPHYLAPVVLFNTIKRTGPSWEFRELHSFAPLPLPSFTLSSSVVQRWPRSYCETGQLSSPNSLGFVCI